MKKPYVSPLIVPEYVDVIIKIGTDNLVSNLNPIELFIYDWLPDDVVDAQLMRTQLQAVVNFVIIKSRQR